MCLHCWPQVLLGGNIYGELTFRKRLQLLYFNMGISGICGGLKFKIIIISFCLSKVFLNLRGNLTLG